MKDYTIFNGRLLSGAVRQELEKKDTEIMNLKKRIMYLERRLNTI